MPPDDNGVKVDSSGGQLRWTAPVAASGMITKKLAKEEKSQVPGDFLSRSLNATS
jgi:hypothetical protein